MDMDTRVIAFAVVALLAAPALSVGTDQEVGQEFLLRPEDLLAPYASESAGNSAEGGRDPIHPPGSASKLPFNTLSL